MVCKQCGNEIAPDSKFCGVCGAVNDGAEAVQYAQPAQPVQPVQPVQPAQPQYTDPQYVQPQYTQPQYTQPQYAQPQYGAAAVEDPQERALSKSTLVFGILGIAFGCSFYLAFLGIIFGAIAMAKAKAYVAAGYMLAGRAKVGKILGTVGMILGIVFTAIVSIIIIAAIVGSASSSSYYYYY